MQDFTLTIYKKLLEKLLINGYSFQTLQDFIQQPIEKATILRHDVDRFPSNALVLGKIEKESGIRASYYFRFVQESYNEIIIGQIADLGHEIGYHYENLSEMSKKNPQIKQIVADFLINHRHTQTHTDICPADTAGQKWSSLREKKRFTEKLFKLAIDEFRLNLETLRKIYPVKTICMHGSPFSRYDNRKLWEKYDYRDYGIIAEPYFDIDFNEVFYLTDTGRSWNNSDASLRDKVNSGFDLKIKDTWDLIKKIENNELPDKIMINVHPQRWHDLGFYWYKELIGQNIKNIIKRCLIKLRD